MKKLITLGIISISAINMTFGSSITKIHPVTILVEHVNHPPKNHVGVKNAMCTASADPAIGTAGENTTVTGYLTYSMTNTTDVYQSYLIDKYMCINGFGCTHTRDVFQVQPKDTQMGDSTVFNMEILPQGTFVDEASVQISGESTCFIQGSNTVTVH